MLLLLMLEEVEACHLRGEREEENEAPNEGAAPDSSPGDLAGIPEQREVVQVETWAE